MPESVPFGGELEYRLLANLNEVDIFDCFVVTVLEFVADDENDNIFG